MRGHLNSRAVPSGERVRCRDTARIRIDLSGEERPYAGGARALDIRHRIVTLSAQDRRSMPPEGSRNDEIAARLDTPRQIVSKWRKRFFEERLGGPRGAPAGRPARRLFPPRVVVEVKALACELPDRSSACRSRAVSCAELAREAVERGIVASIAATTVWRWLARGCDPAVVATAGGSSRATPTSTARRARSSTCTHGRWEGEPLRARRARHLAPTRRPASRPARACHPTAAAGTRAGHAGRARVRAQGRLGLPGRLGRPPGARSSAAASRPPASSPSTAWSTRS